MKLKKIIYNTNDMVYNIGSKVDGSRQVSRLGKDVNEGTHLFRGAPS